MRNVVFVAPFPAETTLRFARATKSLPDVRLLGLVHTPPGGADAPLFDGMALVENPMDLAHLRDGLRSLQAKYGQIHRIIGILEHLQVHIAQLREDLGIPGLDVQTALKFRDKAKMKDMLRAAGLPCARHRLLTSVKDAADFVEEVGFPMVLKPPAGAGCKATWRINTMDQLKEALGAVRPSPQDPTLAEEFLVGREYSLETITVRGKVQMISMTEYHPTPLTVVENPWIQWCVVAPRSLDGPDYATAHKLGLATISALGLQNGMTHMEWFRRNDGSLAIGEIAARPPGANIVRLTGFCYDTSMYRAWARAVVDDTFDGPWERRFASGCAFLRGGGRGRVLGVDGVAKTQSMIGGMVEEAKIPTIGAPKSDSYEGDGFVIVKHPDTEVVKDTLRKVIDNVRVYYA